MTMYNGLNNFRQFHWPIERKYDKYGNFIFEFDCYCSCGGFGFKNRKGDDHCAVHSEAVRHGIYTASKSTDITKYPDYPLSFWDDQEHIDYRRGVRLVEHMHKAYYKTDFTAPIPIDPVELLDIAGWDGVNAPVVPAVDPIKEPLLTVDQQRHNVFYYRGIVDKKNGVDRDNNPFTPSTPEYDDWLAGHSDPYYWKK